MKTLIVILMGIANAAAMSLPPPENSIHFQGQLNTTCLSSRGGTVYLHIDVVATSEYQRPERRRQPMNLSVVLDRSGSMDDERKIEYAKQAIYSLIDRLSSDDYFSLTIYDDQVETIIPSGRLTDRSRIRELVREIYPRGATNLGGGLEEGFRQCNYRSGYINRVILISDGLANRGITDPYELNRMASRYRDQSISLSAIGVGLDFNENLMLGLAEHGGGNYYFIESPAQFASIMDREFRGLSSVVAQNASIELSLGDGVSLADVIGCRRDRDGTIFLGDLYAGEHREVTVELRIGEGRGRRHVATARLICGKDPPRERGRFSVEIRHSDVAAEIQKGIDWDVQGKTDVALSTRNVERAMDALDKGNRDEAARELKDAKGLLNSSGAREASPATAPVIGKQLEELGQYERALTAPGADARKVKKSIQYENYKQQKKKD